MYGLSEQCYSVAGAGLLVQTAPAPAGGPGGHGPPVGKSGPSKRGPRNLYDRDRKLDFCATFGDLIDLMLSN